MDQNRRDRQRPPSRDSDMERTGSWESALDTERMSRERMRGSESGKDLGSTTDRAMFSGRESAESRSMDGSERERDYSSMRDRGHRSERNIETGDPSRNSGGITNRPLEQEQDQQDRLPGRGRSSTER